MTTPSGISGASRILRLAAVRESSLKGNLWVNLPLTETTELERQIHSEYIRRYGYDPILETDKLLEAPFDRRHFRHFRHSLWLIDFRHFRHSL